MGSKNFIHTVATNIIMILSCRWPSIFYGSLRGRNVMEQNISMELSGIKHGTEHYNNRYMDDYVIHLIT